MGPPTDCLYVHHHDARILHCVGDTMLLCGVAVALAGATLAGFLLLAVGSIARFSSSGFRVDERAGEVAIWSRILVVTTRRALRFQDVEGIDVGYSRSVTGSSEGHFVEVRSSSEPLRLIGSTTASRAAEIAMVVHAIVQCPVHHVGGEYEPPDTSPDDHEYFEIDDPDL